MRRELSYHSSREPSSLPVQFSSVQFIQQHPHMVEVFHASRLSKRRIKKQSKTMLKTCKVRLKHTYRVKKHHALRSATINARLNLAGVAALRTSLGSPLNFLTPMLHIRRSPAHVFARATTNLSAYLVS